MSRQWLDLVAQSRTALFISAQKYQLDVEQLRALRAAFAQVVSSSSGLTPTDLFHSTTPECWKSSAGEVRYKWSGDEGAYPFSI